MSQQGGQLMLEFAAEAFQAGNYELAAEIYECQWRERGDAAAGGDSELLLRTADALCRAGRLQESLSLYQRAAAHAQLGPARLEALVLSLAENIRSRDSVCGEKLTGEAAFICPHCGGFLCEPVTLPCGHTFCRSCLDKEPSSCGSEQDAAREAHPSTLTKEPSYADTTYDSARDATNVEHESARGFPHSSQHCASSLAAEVQISSQSTAHADQGCTRGSAPSDFKRTDTKVAVSSLCPKCKEPVNPQTVRSYRINVVLSHLLTKWFPDRVKAQQLRQEGNSLYKRKELLAALHKYDEALNLAPDDHVLYSNRSQINSSLKCNEAALQDAESASRIQPLWLKGHLRKGQALAKLGKMEEALREYLFCLALDTTNKTAKTEAQKLLLSLFSLLSGTSQVEIPDILHLLSHHSRLKGNLNSWGGSSSYNLQSSLKLCAEPERDYNGQHLKMSSSCCDPNQSVQSRGSFLDVECKPLSSEPTGPPQKCIFLKRKLCCSSTSDSRSLEPSNKLIRKDVHGAENTHNGGPFSTEGVDPADLDCSLCMRLFYEPVTTPCGHTFCLKCLERCLDHNSACPLCKEDLSKYLALRKYCKTELLEELIENYLPEEHTDRRKIYEEEVAELSNLNTNVPIFVCTMAYPTVPCPLHIFEPCYRLMIRRCMETGTKQFGMCISDAVKGFADYGCLLEIRNVEFFNDGRSVVDSIGKRRFKVIQHSQRDGYNTADIEYIEDKKVQGTDYAELLTLHNSVYEQACTWFNSLKQVLKSRILSHFGPMPAKDSDPQVNPNGPSWCWWVLAVLPLESKAQLPFLAMTSLKDRLNNIRRVLTFISRSRSR